MLHFAARVLEVQLWHKQGHEQSKLTAFEVDSAHDSTTQLKK
jgi:hypothetical protein